MHVTIFISKLVLRVSRYKLYDKMAFPVSHVVYSKKYLDHHPAMNADLFLLGTILPDIRGVTDEVTRKDTHVIHEKLDLKFEGISCV